MQALVGNAVTVLFPLERFEDRPRFAAVNDGLNTLDFWNTNGH